MTHPHPIHPGPAGIRTCFAWFKSTRSSGSCTCVEVKLGPDAVQIRDSKFRPAHPFDSQPLITIAFSHWPALLAEIVGRASPGSNEAVAIAFAADDSVTVKCRLTGTELTFNAAEWLAFEAGVAGGEFAAPSAA